MTFIVLWFSFGILAATCAVAFFRLIISRRIEISHCGLDDVSDLLEEIEQNPFPFLLRAMLFSPFLITHGVLTAFKHNQARTF